ncbi:SHOCT domain-containing protein [Tamlana haliotis]|uniref:SHOCT domain-containing protein n=1 Tax=Pseudotamlana haliotis TaxID=2614804 RepID=A0A6N6MD52_9FLAO|nr:SHOCT domain-containing protein [Tamlana haliotis]KAB1068592.1 SHOCT domain-containing protein [Tamlana haliotis]
MDYKFTESSMQNIANIANNYGVTIETAMELAHALRQTNGTMAQFYLPELGGGGQWMQGGMTMVGDMFNNQLRALVDGICIAISNAVIQGALQYQPLAQVKNQDGSLSPSGHWWGNLGYPNSSGSQNGTSYAIFNQIHRLAIQENGKVTIFDTLDHQIGGVGQQQGGNYDVNFSSQYGTIDLNTLPVVSGNQENLNHNNNNNVRIDESSTDTAPSNPQPPRFKAPNILTAEEERDVFSKLEKLADLRNKDILTDEEYKAKKAELLKRL